MTRSQDASTRRLLSDHHRELEASCKALLSEAYTNDPQGLVADYRCFERATLEHIDAEEEAILPGYAAECPADAASIREDHAMLRRMLFRVGVDVELHAVRADQINALVQQLQAHAAREESVMYAWAETQVPAHLVERIGRSLQSLIERRSGRSMTQPMPTSEHTGYSR